MSVVLPDSPVPWESHNFPGKKMFCSRFGRYFEKHFFLFINELFISLLLKFLFEVFKKCRIISRYANKFELQSIVFGYIVIPIYLFSFSKIRMIHRPV